MSLSGKIVVSRKTSELIIILLFALVMGMGNRAMAGVDIACQRDASGKCKVSRGNCTPRRQSDDADGDIGSCEACDPGMVCDDRRSVSKISLPGLSLRTLFGLHDIRVGAAVATEPLLNDTLYRTTLAREFSMVTPKDALKFGSVHQYRDRYDFSEADVIVGFAEVYGMEVRGHTLVWEPAPSVSEQLPRNRLPGWLFEKNWAWEESINILRDHITTVVGRYRGRVKVWDVVNEAVAPDGSLRNTFWLRHIGPEYIEMAFRWAHEADPEAKLFYNDYDGEGLGQKSDSIYALLRELLQRGVPIHGVGLQLHVSTDNYPEPKDVAANIQRLSDLGLEVHITEMDVRIEGPATEEKLAEQARIYREMLEAGLSTRKFGAMVLWGFTDRYSWIPEYFNGSGNALIFDKSYRPKLAYNALLEELSE
ncbi:MAG: endo-1,4-beta-xylanase [Nitrospirae bacterium]|nr:endo-1,4-beta-xylanase [Nitrospirota bacterium]